MSKRSNAGRPPKYAREYADLPPILKLGDSLHALCLTLKDDRLIHEKEAKAVLTRLIVQRAGELAEELEKRYAHVPR